MPLTWVSTALRTGEVIADLPMLDVGTIGRVIGAYTTTTASLPVGGQGRDAPPVNWERAVLEGASVLVLLDTRDAGSPRPLWGGMVTQCAPDTSDTVPLSLATLEAYLDRRFSGDVTYTGVGQNEIVADLIARFVATGPNGGIPIRVEYTGPGALRDYECKDAADKSVLSVLTELSALQGGPEWTIGWEHQSDPERYTPVLYVGDRVGVSPVAGLSPAAVFSMPGAVTYARLTRDFTASKGATDVMAVSTASADVRPQSPHVVSGDADRPTFEHRFTPSTDITDTATLTDHATKALAGMAGGARALSLTAVVSAAPRLDVEWSLGDDVGYRIGGLVDDPTLTLGPGDFDPMDFSDDFATSGTLQRANLAGKPSVPAFPNGLAGVARAIGWEMTLGGVQTITPILVLADEGA